MKRLSLIWQAFLLSLSLCMLAAQSAHAQDGMLPKGVGMYQYGYRLMPTQREKYNDRGELVPLGEPLNLDFNGSSFLNGSAGSELKRLGGELQQFDGTNSTPDGLLNTISLGTLHGDVSADVKVQIFALAYGVTDWLTIFAGIPLIDATVRTSLSFAGPNNAALIKQRLGDAAFDELKDGLDKAGRISVRDVENSMINAGYQPIDYWRHSGVGDLRLGGILNLYSRTATTSKYTLNLSSTLMVPTGYVDDPDVLTDFGFGSGYYSIVETLSQTWSGQYAWLTWDNTVGLNLPTTRDVRLQEGEESLPEADRRMTLDYKPGNDLETRATLGFKLGVIKPSYVLGYRQHFRDDYSGSAEGNYQALSATSATTAFYQEAIIALDTTTAYQMKKFPIPFIFSAMMHDPLYGKNSVYDRYYEFTIASFFQIPAF